MALLAGELRLASSSHQPTSSSSSSGTLRLEEELDHLRRRWRYGRPVLGVVARSSESVANSASSWSTSLALCSAIRADWIA